MKPWQWLTLNPDSRISLPVPLRGADSLGARRLAPRS
jgi:hypothetical protein